LTAKEGATLDNTEDKNTPTAGRFTCPECSSVFLLTAGTNVTGFKVS
jgi:competence CoiA-like predicted nuclease